MRRAAIVVLVFATVAAGCGAQESGGQAESQQHSEPVPVETLGDLDSWGTEMAEPELKDFQVSLVDELAVFSRPRKPEDEFPALVMAEGSDSAEGRELAAQTRLLLGGVATEDIDELGPQRLSLYGVPTDRGWVCAYIVYDELGEIAVGAACEHGLLDGLGLELQGEGPHYRLYGVVDNEIERGWIEIGRRLLPARVGNNGIYFEADARNVCPTEIDAVVVERSGGARTSIPWARLAPAVAGSPGEFGCR